MLKFIAFCFLIVLSSTYAHNNRFSQNLQNDANMQSDLMPQELNTAFEGEDLDSVKPSFQPHARGSRRPRTRRNADVAVVADAPYVPSGIAEHVKQYSRVIACFVLVVSAAIEVVVYIIESYQSA